MSVYTLVFHAMNWIKKLDIYLDCLQSPVFFDQREEFELHYLGFLWMKDIWEEKRGHHPAGRHSPQFSNAMKKKTLWW